MAKKGIVCTMVVALLIAVSACGGAASSGGDGPGGKLEKLVVRLNYTPWAMHNYLYAALDQGFFKDHGLDVEIKAAQSGQSVQFVGTGKEDIGMTDATTMLSAVAKGAPLVAIAMDQPVSPGAFFYLKKSGITKAKDLEGRSVCTPNGSNFHDALLAGLKRQGVNMDKIKFTSINPGSEVTLLASGKCDVAEGVSYGQPLTLESKGLPADSLSVGDLGVDLYGVVLFANQTKLEKDNDKLTRFMEAVGEGQDWAYKNMKLATKSTLERTEGRTVENEVEKVELIYDTYRENDEFAERWGNMTAKSWRQNISELKEIGTLEEDVSVDDIFTNQFVDSAESTKKFAALCAAEKPQE